MITYSAFGALNRVVMNKGSLTVLLIAFLFNSSLAFAEDKSAEVEPPAPRKYWVQAQFGISLLDDRSDTPVKRTGLGLQVGVRDKSNWGVFLNARGNRSVEFTGDKPDIDYAQFGPGIDYLFPSRQLRSSISTGMTVLTRAVNEEHVGKRGWYLDVRPVSVRFPLESGGTIEFTPLNIDISIPEESGSLSMYGNFTVLAYEW